jgi:CheY-like chemotaxis protein
MIAQLDFLTVDDQSDINWILERLITRCGFRVHQARSGQEALELGRRHHYCGIFVDAKLPDMEGPLLIRHLRQIQISPYIILISGYFFPDDPTVIRAKQEGLIQGFISKPFFHEEILAVVDHIASGYN